MKPIKITAELIITPESFKEWCGDELNPSEYRYKRYVEEMLYNRFGSYGDLAGSYKDFVNQETDDGNGRKLKVEELPN